jgi:arsenate reductase
MDTKKLYPKLAETIKNLSFSSISEERKKILQPLIAYLKAKKEKQESIQLNFICTHNSRRSQFSQVWAQTAAYCYDISVSCFSGGVEVTACNERVIKCLKNQGFQISGEGNNNPVYRVAYTENAAPAQLFSKTFDDDTNPKEGFAAVMTCSDADVNCPFVPGTEKRISITYEDPKAFDDTPQETEKYTERSLQIATELFYVFSQVN